MKICHDEEADNSDDDTPKFDTIVRGDAVDEIVGNFLVIENHGAAGDKN